MHIDTVTTTDDRYHIAYGVSAGRPYVSVTDQTTDAEIYDGTGHTLVMPPDREHRDDCHRDALPTEWIRHAYQRGFTVVYPDGYVQPGWSQVTAVTCDPVTGEARR